MSTQRRVRIRLAIAYVAAGVAVLTLLAVTQPFPNFLLWFAFALPFIYLEWRAVEINDQLMASSTIMVALTGGTIFAIEGSSAALGMAAIAAVGPLVPRDFRERRWFQPAVNFGQLVISAGFAGLALDLLIPTGIDPSAAGNIARVVGAASVAAVAYAILNYGQVRSIVKAAFGRRDIRPWSGMAMILPAYFVMGVLGGFLGIVYATVGFSVLPLILVVFVAGHYTFASYGELREAHEATLRGFIKALEAKDLYTRGHTERVAYFAQLVGEDLGFRGSRLERVRVAALIHDVGKLAVPRDLIRKRGRLTEEEYENLQSHAHVVEEILAEVEFLRPMVEIASGHHSQFDGSGYGGSGHQLGKRPSMEARILAVADAFDAMTSTRSYRMALSQEYAFEELRRNAGTQFDPAIVESLVRALTRTGERYGSPGLVDEEQARRMAEGRTSGQV
ncbi:MAG TPA: HD-GYP domain-containing protein [Acidimicrobiia bacterium]|nr:HD-GYP domain-containing protein [Acidimicrobiia bacterium]